MASTTVSSDTVERAVHALLKWRAAKAKTEKPQLLEQDEFFYLVLTLKKIPQGRTNPFKIPIPHALIDPEVAETCLIIDDRPTSKLTKAAAQEKIKAEGIQVSKVMKLSKLRSDYKAFESKRKLCDSYDMFLADKRILPVLPKVLGKQFFKKKKIPVGVDLTHNNWKEQIERVYGSALLFLGTGTCSVVRVARVSIGEKEIAENVVAAIKGIAEVVPRKWGNVRSFHVKMLESLALPIYQTVPDVKLKIEGVKDREEKELKEVKEKGEVKDEVSAVKKKKGPKKGRIHEVKYMDADLDEIVDDDDDSDNNDATDEVVEEHEAVAVGKKRKKGSAEKEEAVAELNEDKKVKKSAKLKKGSSGEEEKSVVSEKLKKSDSAKKKKKDSLSVKGSEELSSEKEKKKTKKKDSSTVKVVEVKYMDADLDEIVDDDDDSDNNATDEAVEDYESVAVGKKRKKGSAEKEAVAELNGDKKVKKSAKLKKASSGEEEKCVVSEKLKKSDSAKTKKDSSSVKGCEELSSEKEKKKTKKKGSSTVKVVQEINSEKKKTKKKKL